MTPTKPKIGISACVAGEAVRYNGGAATQAWVAETLARWVELVPVCPEVAMGLGVPREALRLVRHGKTEAPRLESSRNHVDHTDLARRTSADLVAALPLDLDGFILMNRSPTCGLTRVKVYDGNGAPSAEGIGLFAEALTKARPDMPVIEAGRLTEAPQRETFLARIYALARLRTIERRVSALQAFHARHKFMILAHGRVHLTRLGAIAANATASAIEVAIADYALELGRALAKPPKPGQLADALTHMYGFVKRALKPVEKQTLLARIEAHRRGEVPLDVPLSLLAFVNETVADDYLGTQALFMPFPEPARRDPKLTRK